MGCKIFVDLVIMMNKGLEYIEVCWLFNVSVSQMEVLIYLQLVIYLMVCYQDGSVLVQLGELDMCMLIVYIMVWLNCVNFGVKLFDFCKLSVLIFVVLDYDCYLCLKLVMEVFEKGQVVMIVLNVVNEIIVVVFFV